MGNHASVIVAFSTIDHKACPIAGPNDGGQGRCNDLLRAYYQAKGGTDIDFTWPALISSGCSDGSLGMACECVMTFHVNHFSADTLFEVLAGFDWDMPEEVEVFWKTEDDEQYQRNNLDSWRKERLGMSL